jgi:hypothetical protein
MTQILNIQHRIQSIFIVAMPNETSENIQIRNYSHKNSSGSWETESLNKNPIPGTQPG